MNLTQLLAAPLEEDAFYEKLKAYIRENPPQCLSGLSLSATDLPAPVDQFFMVSYKVGCNCGAHSAKFLGYPLKDYSGEYSGADFLSPYSFSCLECQNSRPLLDSGLHGYHVEMDRLRGKATDGRHMRGHGTPVAFTCPACLGCSFILYFATVYWHFDLFIDVAEEIIEHGEGEDQILRRAQDFFNEAIIQLICGHCNAISEPSHLGKL